MEARKGTRSGFTMSGVKAYHVAPRMENESQIVVSPVVAAAAINVGLTGSTEKKKRGRPRKYRPDETVSQALSPTPILSSVRASGESSSAKGGKVRPSGSGSKQYQRTGTDNLGKPAACDVGTNFLHHIITVDAGEDVTTKVISFSQQEPRAICILSANGEISKVTLRQPDPSGRTLTHDGPFDILSLSGSFIPTENQGTGSRSGGMSVSLANKDGIVVGGGVIGPMVAASLVNVVVGSFLPGGHNQKEHKQKTN